MQRLNILSAVLKPKCGGAKRIVNYATPVSETAYTEVEDSLTAEFPTYSVVSLRFLTVARLLP